MAGGNIYAGALAGITYLSGLAVGARSLYSYLRSGEWAPFSTLDALSTFYYGAWVRNPTDWLGLHRFLAETSWVISSAVLGSLLVWIAATTDD